MQAEYLAYPMDNSQTWQQKYEALQMEEANSYEKLRRANARMHQQLLELVTALTPSPQSMSSPSAIKEDQLAAKSEPSKSIPMMQPNANGNELEIHAPIEKKQVRHPNPYLKSSVPEFYGEDPKVWLENCEKYFSTYQIPKQQWIGIASLHIGGNARFWKQAYFFNRPRVNWSEFSDAICKRFTASKERYPIREFCTYEQPDSIESCQKKCEAIKMYGIMMQENSCEHEQLLNSPRGQHMHDERNEIKVQGTVEEFGPLPALKSTEGGDSPLADSVISSKAEVRKLEQSHYEDQKMKLYNTKCEVKLRDSVSEPEELLKPLTAQPSLLKPAPNVPNAYTTSEETATSDQMKRQGKCEEYRDGNVTRQQCRNGSLYALQSPLKAKNDDEVEIVKEGCELQEVEGYIYEAASIESNNQTLLIFLDDRNRHSLIDFEMAMATKVESTTFAPLIAILDRDYEMPNKSYYPQFAKKKREHQFLADSSTLGLKNSDAILGVDWMKEYRQVPFDPGPNKVTIHSIEGASHMPIIISKLPMVNKHRGQTIAAQPYRIKSGATIEESHAHIQELPGEIKGSTQEKEFIAILWEESNQLHAKSFPKTEFLMYSGDDPRNWIRSDEKYLELHQISNQQEVDFATMLRQQERSQDLRNQLLRPVLSLAEACHVWGYVNEYRKLGTVLKRPHPCSRFLAYEQDKLQESNRNLGVTLHIKGECKALATILCKWMQAVQNRSGEDHLLIEFHTSGAWQVDQGVEQFTRGSGIRRDLHQLVQNCEVCLRAKEENRPEHYYKKLKLEECWSYTRFHNSTGKRILQSPVARRLRLPEEPKGEPPPQQVPPSILPTRDARQVLKKEEEGNTADQRKGVRKQSRGSILLKRSIFEEECAARGANVSPTQFNQFHP